jgi:hypothetical protein
LFDEGASLLLQRGVYYFVPSAARVLFIIFSERGLDLLLPNKPSASPTKKKMTEKKNQPDFFTFPPAQAFPNSPPPHTKHQHNAHACTRTRRDRHDDESTTLTVETQTSPPTKTTKTAKNNDKTASRFTFHPPVLPLGTPPLSSPPPPHHRPSCEWAA